jgi:hypothetical protein
MTQGIKLTKVSIGLVVMFFIFVGCAAHPKKVINPSRYNFTIQDSEDHIISNVHVTQKGNKYMIYGSVSAQFNPDKITSGKIEALFTKTDGTVLKQIFAPILTDHDHDLGHICIHKQDKKPTHFSIPVTKTLLENSVITLRYFNS